MYIYLLFVYSMANLETSFDGSYREKYDKEINEKLSLLKNDILLNTDPWITKQPTLRKWAAVFDYKYNWQDWEVVTRKEGNGNYSVRIKKKVRFPDWKFDWQTQKNWEKDTFDFTANDKITFNRKLWGALDSTIWKDRERLPRTGWIVYDLLNGPSSTPKPQQKPAENKAAPKEKKENVETRGMPKWLKLDHWTFVYTVQDGDCEWVIKEKLQNYAPLRYLKDIPDGITWYNFNTIPDKKLLPWLKLVVPKKSSEKTKTVSEFKKSQRSALNEMKNNPTYWKQINKLIKQFWENHIVNVMTAYAKSETCPEDYDNKVWKFALFRYEDSYKCPSYGYHHVLYIDSGLRAFGRTWITVGQCCNPKDSGKLFLAFCIEKSRNNYRKFFDLGNRINLAWAAYNYNWPKYRENHYDTKLKRNFDVAKSTK